MVCVVVSYTDRYEAVALATLGPIEVPGGIKVPGGWLNLENSSEFWSVIVLPDLPPTAAWLVKLYL